MPTQSRCAWLIGAACLMAAASGCCVKRGFIIRADCSLELNRVPWMTGNGPEYEKCDTQCKDCKSGECKEHGAAGQQGQGAAAEEADEPLPGPPGHTRLHPVPTGPVFGPMPGHPIPTDSVPERPVDTPAPAPTPSDSRPMQAPALEELTPPSNEPTPAPSTGPGSSVSRPRRSLARQTSWTFVAPRETKSKQAPKRRSAGF